MHTEALASSPLRAVWHLFDPKVALAFVVPLVVGMAIAYAEGHAINPWIAFAAMVAVSLVEVGRNAVDQISGSKAMRLDDVLSDADLTEITWVSLIAAAVIGTFIAHATEPSVLFVGVAATAVALAYSMGPLRLSDRGLGELVIGLVYGPAMVLGTVLMFGADVTLTAVVFSVVLGLLVANVALISGVEQPDRHADRRTLAVRIGRVWTARLVAALFVVAFGLAVVFFFTIAAVPLVGLLLGVIPADFAAWSLRSEPAGAAKARLAALIAYGAAALGTLLMLIAVAW